MTRKGLEMGCLGKSRLLVSHFDGEEVRETWWCWVPYVCLSPWCPHQSVFMFCVCALKICCCFLTVNLTCKFTLRIRLTVKPTFREEIAHWIYCALLSHLLGFGHNAWHLNAKTCFLLLHEGRGYEVSHNTHQEGAVRRWPHYLSHRLFILIFFLPLSNSSTLHTSRLLPHFFAFHAPSLRHLSHLAIRSPSDL